MTRKREMKVIFVYKGKNNIYKNHTALRSKQSYVLCITLTKRAICEPQDLSAGKTGALCQQSVHLCIWHCFQHFPNFSSLTVPLSPFICLHACLLVSVCHSITILAFPKLLQN